MKYLGFILIMMASVASQDLSKKIKSKDSQLNLSRISYDDKLRNFLENARIIIREGNSTLGIPVLDPFIKDIIQVELEEDFMKGKMEVSNFTVTGLAGYTVDKAQLSLLSRKLIVGLTFPYIYSKGSYKLNVSALETVEAYGDGDYTFTLTDLSFESSVWMRVSPSLGIKKMETQITLGALDLSATGIFHDGSTSKILSEVISDMAPQLLKDYQKELTSAINDKVTKLADEYLKGRTISDVIAILG